MVLIFASKFEIGHVISTFIIERFNRLEENKKMHIDLKNKPYQSMFSVNIV